MLSSGRQAVIRPSCCHEEALLSSGRHAVIRPPCCHEEALLSSLSHYVVMYSCFHIGNQVVHLSLGHDVVLLPSGYH